MRRMEWPSIGSIVPDRAAWFAAAFLTLASVAAVFTPSARASLGYELDASNPNRALPGGPRGIAVDQESGDIYVAIVSTNPNTGAPGQISRFDSNLAADGVFAPGGGYYSGVAVDPLTHGFYGMQVKIDLAIGSFGTPRLDRFSSSGTSVGSFPVADAGAFPPIATDSAGNVFYPNADGHSVQVFDSAGVLQEVITCGGCPGGSFGRPISVALNSTDDLYVADVSPDRVVKLTSSGGSYSFASILQSGRGAAAVGVDPVSGDVLVGDLPGGRNYHIVAYNSSGTQFDDFGAGLFADPPSGSGANLAYQMAVSATTHKVYVGEDQQFYVFEKVPIDPPTADIEPVAAVGQLTARLSATVNANGHATLDCEFEYTDHADFQANGFANAPAVPCAALPGGSGDTAINAKVAGLLPVTTYHFRVTATSNGGSVTSGAETFETLPVVPPTVTTESPLAVAQTTARLKGKVNPHGGSASDCHFEYGTSLSYGSSIPCLVLPEPVTTDVAEERKVLGLTPGTAYHYRLVVSTNAGTMEGDDVEFTTAALPPEPEPGPGPAPEPVAPPATAPPPTAPIVTPRPLRCKKGFRKRRVRGKAKCVKRKHPTKHGRRPGRRR